MDSNDVAIILACFTSITALVVACVTAYFNRQAAHGLEAVKSQLQKEQVKFTSYHAKQVEVLAEIFKKAASAQRLITELHISWENSFVVDPKSEVGYLEGDFEWCRSVYVDFAGEEPNKLYNKTLALYSYTEDHSIYIDDKIINHINEVTALITQFLSDNRNYVNCPIYDPYIQKVLDKTFVQILDQMPILLTALKADIKVVLE